MMPGMFQCCLQDVRKIVGVVYYRDAHGHASFRLTL
jgi:hypothetical protein